MGKRAKGKLEDRTPSSTPVNWMMGDLGTVKSSAKGITKGHPRDAVRIRLPDLANKQTKEHIHLNLNFIHVKI